jgi:Uma2 family endonuclease
MATVEQHVPPLIEGQRLTRDEFMRRWEAHPEIKFAELIGGVVYMASPLSRAHGVTDNSLSTWLGVYKAHTAGTEAGNNATTHLLQDAPQPDIFLRILPDYGGRSGMAGKYIKGAAELLTEISISSAERDLHEKLELYQKAGVQEYLVVVLEEHEVRWHRLVGGRYELMAPGEDGILRSGVFPGLWLDASALLAGDLARVLQVLQQGILSSEHAAFVERLKVAKKP